MEKSIIPINEMRVVLRMGISFILNNRKPMITSKNGTTKEGRPNHLSIKRIAKKAPNLPDQFSTSISLLEKSFSNSKLWSIRQVKRYDTKASVKTAAKISVNNPITIFTLSSEKNTVMLLVVILFFFLPMKQKMLLISYKYKA